MTSLAPSTTKKVFATAVSAFVARAREILLLPEGENPSLFQKRVAPALFEEMNRSRILSLILPEEYGGGNGGPTEVLSLLEAVSYESLPLGLVFGINMALFIQPLAKYGEEDIKRRVFSRFAGEGALGGLMLTEPDYGTDLLSMRTMWERQGEEVTIKGRKHWAGLSGRADFWLMSARERKEDGSLKRDIDFFVCDSSIPEQRVILEEPYPNLGLLLIPYGSNRVDLRLPAGNRLERPGSGVRLLLDLLHRSRLSFGGMAVGFFRRLLDESLGRARARKVGGRSILAYDQVERRIAEIQAAYTIATACCRNALGYIDLGRDLAGEGLLANIHKALLTDLMQECSQSFLQLSGGDGYRLDRFAGQAAVDSRPFQIFEGSNDVLYDQIATTFLAELRAGPELSLADFLRRHKFTAKAAGRFSDLLDFKVEREPPQRNLVDLGKILARVVAGELLVDLEDSGYDATLTGNALEVLHLEVAGLAARRGGAKRVRIVEDYPGNGSWRKCPS